MIILFPLRVEEAEVDRVPIVSIGIAVICFVLFLGTYALPHSPYGVTDESVHNVLTYWRAHPYLELSPRLRKLFNTGPYEERHAQALESEKLPPAEVIADEQKQLDGWTETVIQAYEKSSLRKYALVPERGFFQRGLLTHMFLHLGWWHLLGNMLFLYLTALMLEDRWGRVIFSAFYLVGGVVSAGAQYLMDRHSSGFMVGASGAIAACMGAFAVIFAMRQIRMVYFVWLFLFKWWRGTFLLRAWVFGVIWFAMEVLNLVLDDGRGGVAFAAHVGGFAFGAAIALSLKYTKVHEKVIAPMVDKVGIAYARPPALDRAEQALAGGDVTAAQKELGSVLLQAPDHVDANLMMIKAELAANQVAAAHSRTERFMAKLFAKASPELAHVVEELAPHLDRSRLRPVTAFRMGQALDGGPDGLRPLAEQLFAAAAAQSGPFAAKALVRAAQLRLDSNGEAQGALEYLERFRALAGAPPDLAARAGELERRARAAMERDREGSAGFSGRAIELEEEPAPPTGAGAGPPMTAEPADLAPAEPSRSGAQVVECQLGGMTREALSLVMEDGQEAQVSIAKLLAVAVGVASEQAAPLGPPRHILYTDLVTSWGGPARPAQVLRLKSSTLRLNNIYPGMKPSEAYGLFLSFLLDESGATALPDAAALRRGEYPRFPDVESFTRAVYG